MLFLLTLRNEFSEQEQELLISIIAQVRGVLTINCVWSDCKMMFLLHMTRSNFNRPHLCISVCDMVTVCVSKPCELVELVLCYAVYVWCAENRPYVFLTSRVHPGESNASWVMKGQHHNSLSLSLSLSLALSLSRLSCHCLSQRMLFDCKGKVKSTVLHKRV